MPRYPQHLTVRSQILALMLVVVLPAAAGVAWALSAVLASEKDAATAQVRATSTQVANNLGLLLREREALLDRLAGLVRRPDAGPDPCTALAAEWPRLSPDGSGLSVFGLDGQRRCGAGSNPLAATPVRDAPWFARALDAASPQAGPVLPGIAPGSWTAPLV